VRHIGLLLALPLIACSLAGTPGTSEGYEGGGPSARFDAIVNQYNQSGEPFRIVGYCASSCTLFLGIRTVCVSRHATLGFHSAHAASNLGAPSDHMLAAYNQPLRDFIVANHYLATAAMSEIPGSEMIDRFGYRECAPA
jgi:hypothetical protein